MASRKHRKAVTPAEKQRKDRITTARKAQIEEMQAREAEMELRSVLQSTRRVSVVCPNCRFRSDHELDSRVPVVPCPNCRKPLGLQASGVPQVVSR